MNIHFGADYYPEHWPEERWETDAGLMKEMGLKVVRLAEFSWHKMEPQEGVFDFEWLDRAVYLLEKYGIKVILGTPTAAPPAWLVNKYPEILPVDHMGNTHGFGGRHHDCQSNPGYRKLCSQIVTAMCEHFKDNANVIGWQIDNELGNSHDDFCNCPSCRRKFQEWLKNKYGTIEKLNEKWGTAFWSQDYNSFEEIFTPGLTAAGENPSQMLDWRCFHSDLIVDFAKAQADIIRTICPNHFITHNCMDFADTVNYYDLGKLLDFACQDQYPLGYWFENCKMSVYRAAACVDLVRSFKKEPVWIMEQEAGITGWGKMGRLPKPEELPEMTLQSIAHGADCVVFFRWRSCAFGTEQYWHGILPHSGIPGRNYAELKKMIEHMEPVMDELTGAMPKNDVAIEYSYRQQYALRSQPHNDYLNYQNQILKYYSSLYDKHIGVDFVGEKDPLEKYKLVIAPLKYVSYAEDAERFEKYVGNGGVLILTMRAGVKDEFNICNTSEPLPGIYRRLAGITISEYDSLGQVSLVVDDENSKSEENAVKATAALAKAGETAAKEKEISEKFSGKACVWADLIEADCGAVSLARYGEEFYKGTTVVSMNTYGKGKCIYVGCEPDSELMDSIIARALKEADVNVGFRSDEGVDICTRENENGIFTFVINTTCEQKHYFGVGGSLVYGEDDEEGILRPFCVHIYKKDRKHG